MDVGVIGRKRRRREEEECPYLDTIDRSCLDFDLEKICCKSLSKENVYACLVCGNYYQGRGKLTHAYTHSTMCGHHIFIHLESCRIYCLPENYEVMDSSLNDIVKCLKPDFDLKSIDTSTSLARDIQGVSYLPGFCGLNNLGKTDYINVVIHALAHVKPLRDFFLVTNLDDTHSGLLLKFGQLIRKLWSRQNFKSVISPHEFVQEVTKSSSFQINVRADAVEFLMWLLHYLHKALKKADLYIRNTKTTIIHAVFMGKLKIETLSRKAHLSAVDDNHHAWEKSEKEIPFLCLALDIPPTPLFKDSRGGNVIPQIPIYDLLAKYNGTKYTDSVANGIQYRRRFSILKLPHFLIFHFLRFSKNNFYAEKNTTIVNSPVKNLELSDHFAFEPQASHATSTKFDLVANVCHDLPAELLGKEKAQQDPLQFGSYRAHLNHTASNQWYEIQDLHVAETMPQLIGLSESFFSIYASSSSSSSISKLSHERAE